MGACLSCGKQLGSLKRFAGSDQFCSEAHRLSYQAESNRLALERLQRSKNRRPRGADERSAMYYSTGEDSARPSTLVLDPPSPDAALDFSQAAPEPGEEVVTQDTQTPRYSVALAGASDPVFPIAGAIGPEEFLYAAGESAETLKPVASPPLPFETTAVICALDATELETLGYDDPALIEAARAEFGLDEGAYVAVEPEPPGPSKLKLAIELSQPIAPPPAAPMSGFAGVAPVVPKAVVPMLSWEAHTLRSRIVRGKNPNAPKPVVPQPAKPVVTPPPAPVATKPALSSKASPAVTVRPPVKSEPPVKPAAKVEAPKPEVKVAPAAKVEPPKPEVKVAPVAKVEVKPEVKIAPAPPKPETPKPEIKTPPAAPAAKTEQEKPKITVRPAATAAQGSAAPKIEEPAAPLKAEAPAPKPRVVEIPKQPDPVFPIGRPIEDGFMSGVSPAVKGGLAAAVCFLVFGGGYYLFSGSKAAPTRARAEVETAADPTPAGDVIGGGGWTSTWGSTEAINKGKQISIFRPTANLADYRMDFRGQIEKKALGWIFRAKDPKNYYVSKLEIIRPGLEPVIALVKYAVINGKESTRTQVMLAPGYKMDTVYRVRVDVQGNKFTTYVQDKLIDYWTDDQIKFGAAGFYNDRGERANVKTSQIAHLK